MVMSFMVKRSRAGRYFSALRLGFPGRVVVLKEFTERNKRSTILSITYMSLFCNATAGNKGFLQDASAELWMLGSVRITSQTIGAAV